MIKLNVLKEENNPILKRKDLMISLEHLGESTPKTIDAADMIVKKYKTKLENVEVVYLFTDKGIGKTKMKARIWEEGSPKKVEVKKKEGADSEGEASGDAVAAESKEESSNEA